MLAWRFDTSRSYGRWACDCHSEVAWFRVSTHGPIHKAWLCINHCICRAMAPRDPFFPSSTWWDDNHVARCGSYNGCERTQKGCSKKRDLGACKGTSLLGSGVESPFIYFYTKKEKKK